MRGARHGTRASSVADSGAPSAEPTRPAAKVARPTTGGDPEIV